MSTLATYAETIHRSGPRRIVVDKLGTAMSPDLAKKLGPYTEPDIIYIRDDGWSLGAPKKFAKIAFEQWTLNWIGYIYRGQNEVLGPPVPYIPGDRIQIPYSKSKQATADPIHFSLPDHWTPTPYNVGKLPNAVRDYIFQLEAQLDVAEINVKELKSELDAAVEDATGE